MLRHKSWVWGLAIGVVVAWAQEGAAQPGFHRHEFGFQIDPLVLATLRHAQDPMDDAAPMEGDADEEETIDTSSRVPAEPADPREIRLHLHDGAILTGQLKVDSIEVETIYGTLVIPVEEIVSITPGLESRPELFEKINTLVEALGGDDYQAREDSVKALLNMGPPVREELNRYRDDSNAERKRRILEILEKLNEQVDELEEEFAFGEADDSLAPWIRLDTVESKLFTVVGTVSPNNFEVESPYGELAVTLGQIEYLARNVGRAAEITRVVRIEGSANMVQATWKSSGIRVERGDQIRVRADGSVTMSPWGSDSVTGPDGGSNYGMWRPGIQGGSLVARISSSGDPIMIGSQEEFTATRSGLLEFAIAVQDQYSPLQGYSYPGAYRVRLKVQPAE